MAYLNLTKHRGKERAQDITGLTLMGALLYNNVTGHFTSVDPVEGGNTTTYAYPQDPINQFDLDGNAGWWKKNWKKVARGAAAVVGVAAYCVIAKVGCAQVSRAVAKGVTKKIGQANTAGKVRYGSRLAAKNGKNRVASVSKNGKTNYELAAKAHFNKSLGKKSRLLTRTFKG